jgi:hypothetical protein
VYSVSASLDQDSVRYWENEIVKNSVASGLIDMGADPEEALRYIGSNIRMKEQQNAVNTQEVTNALLSKMAPYNIMHQRLHQGIFRYTSGGKYTLEKIHNLALNEL